MTIILRMDELLQQRNLGMIIRPSTPNKSGFRPWCHFTRTEFRNYPIGPVSYKRVRPSYRLYNLLFASLWVTGKMSNVSQGYSSRHQLTARHPRPAAPKPRGASRASWSRFRACASRAYLAQSLRHTSRSTTKHSMSVTPACLGFWKARCLEGPFAVIPSQ